MMHNDIEFPVITYATNLIGGIIQTLAPDGKFIVNILCSNGFFHLIH